MKVDCHGNFHLTYCTNIHPGESWKEVFANLKTYLLPLKERLSSDRPFGVGLRLADVAARELCLEDNLKSFQEWLNQHDLYVFTLNGFPYGGFHRQVVKDRVYAPDWSRSERLDYTLRLAEILATLLPEGMDGGISTVPLSYKPWWENQPSAAATVRQNCCANLARFVAEIIRIREQTGKQLHVDLEPEPDGLIENTAEAIDFFQQDLLPEGGAFLVRTLGISRGAAERELLAGIRLCYDTCHFAVEYEEPRSALTRLLATGISIGKVQLSAALQVDLGDSVQQRRAIAEHLRPFAESTYLHQTSNAIQMVRYSDIEI
jgi:sugar phosphate isomerase/epimerase